MYVCLCRGVTDTALRQAVAQGICSLPELAQQLGLGTGCGRCLDEAVARLGPELRIPVRHHAVAAPPAYAPAI